MQFPATILTLHHIMEPIHDSSSDAATEDSLSPVLARVQNFHRLIAQVPPLTNSHAVVQAELHVLETELLMVQADVIVDDPDPLCQQRELRAQLSVAQCQVRLCMMESSTTTQERDQAWATMEAIQAALGRVRGTWTFTHSHIYLLD